MTITRVKTLLGTTSGLGVNTSEIDQLKSLKSMRVMYSRSGKHVLHKLNKLPVQFNKKLRKHSLCAEKFLSVCREVSDDTELYHAQLVS